jgi:CHASE3 domain sensor protein
VSAADASIQSFVITAEHGYVTDYSQAISDIHEQLERLRGLTADNTRQQKRLDNLVPQVDSSTRAFQNEIDAKKNGTLAAEKLLPLEQVVRKADDDIRATIGEMDEEERDLLIQRTEVGATSQSANEFTALTWRPGSISILDRCWRDTLLRDCEAGQSRRTQNQGTGDVAADQ